MAATPTFNDGKRVYLRDIYTYDENIGIIRIFIVMMLGFPENFQVEKSGAMRYGSLTF